MAKVFAALVGRAIRKWYSQLPPNKQRHFYETFMRNRRKLAIGALICGGIKIVYIFFHIEKTPITGRWRYVALTQKQFLQAVDYEVEAVKDRFYSWVLLPCTSTSISTSSTTLFCTVPVPDL